MSEFEDLIGLWSDSWILQGPLEQLEGCPEVHYNTEGCRSKKGWDEGAITKEKEICLDQDIFFWGKGTARVFTTQIASSSYGVGCRGPGERLFHCLLTKKIPNWLIIFLKNVKIANRSSIRPRFSIETEDPYDFVVNLRPSNWSVSSRECDVEVPVLVSGNNRMDTL